MLKGESVKWGKSNSIVLPPPRLADSPVSERALYITIQNRYLLVTVVILILTVHVRHVPFPKLYPM